MSNKKQISSKKLNRNEKKSISRNGDEGTNVTKKWNYQRIRINGEIFSKFWNKKNIRGKIPVS